MEDLGEILRVDHLCVLNLEEVLSTMTIHVDEYLRPLITLESLRLGHL